MDTTANSLHIDIQVVADVHKARERFRIIDFNPMQGVFFNEVMIAIAWLEYIPECARQDGDKQGPSGFRDPPYILIKAACLNDGDSRFHE